MHYLNHAACGLMSDATRQTIDDHLRLEQALGGYGAAKQMQDAVADVYGSVAHTIHAQPQDIALTQGNSDGWTRLVAAMDWQGGGRILVARNEWGGNLGLLMQLQAQYGVQIEAISCHVDGQIDLDALQTLLKTPASLVALTWFSSNSPPIQPAHAIGALCAQHGVPFVVDAAQAIGQWPVDVQSLQCAALTASGRKWLRGPRGTGFVYIRPDFLHRLKPTSADHFSRPWQSEDLWSYRSDARRLEQSEASIALRLGLGQALEETLRLGIPHIQAQIQQRAVWLRQALQELPATQVHCSSGTEMSGIVTVECTSHSHAEIHTALQRHGIEAAICPVAFTPWDMQARKVPSVLRFSPSYDTTWESLQWCVDVLAKLLKA